MLLCLAAAGYAKENSPSSDEILMQCDSFQLDDKNHILTTKNSITTYGEIKIYAPFGKYDLKSQYGLLTGRIKIIYPDTIMTSDRLEIFYLEKKCILSGQVEVLSRRQLGKLEDKKIMMTCQRLEYFLEQKKGKAQGNVKIFQKKGIVFCDYADYDAGGKLAHLTGNVRFEYYKGDWLICQEAWVNLEKDTFSASGDVEGRFLVESKKTKAKQEEEKVLTPEPAYIPLEPVVPEAVTSGKNSQ